MPARHPQDQLPSLPEHISLLSPPTLIVKHECLQQAELPVLPTVPLGMGKRRSSVSLSILPPALVCFGCGWHTLPPLLLLWLDSHHSISIHTYPPPPSPSVHPPAPGLAEPISTWILLCWPRIHSCDIVIPQQLRHPAQLCLKFTQDQAQAYECCI